MVDLLFFLAVGAIGWGCRSPPTGAWRAMNGWPLGSAQTIARRHDGHRWLASIAPGLMFATARGPLHGGVVIVIFGVALAIFWSGFLRVGAQSALLLAPLSAVALLIAWSA